MRRPADWRAAGGLVIAALLVSVGAASAVPSAGGEVTAEQPRDGSGGDRLLIVTLTDVRRIAKVPPEVIERSKFGPLPIVRAFLEEWPETYERAAMGEPMATPINGMITATYYDRSRNRFIVAGYENDSGSGQGEERKPYLDVTNDRQRVRLSCDFEIVPEDDGADLRLRQVLALDADSIYLDAESASGEQVFLVAHYTIRETDAEVPSP